jgi:hypothetical protein
LPLKHNPLLLIDANLAERPLAQALRLVDYNAEAVSDKFGQGAPDPIIIQWLGLQGGVWVTADEHAKREHAEEIKAAGIHILWVRRPKKQGFSKKAQLLLLLWIADDVLNHIAGAKNPAQFLAQYSGQRPKVVKL